MGALGDANYEASSSSSIEDGLKLIDASGEKTYVDRITLINSDAD